MGRLLGPADYGVLAVLMSVVYIFSVPSEAIQNIISRYTSKLNVKKEYGKIKFLMFKSLKKASNIAFWVFLIALLFSIFLSKFLDIDFWLIFITDILIFASFLNPVTKGILQGRKKFGLLGNNMILESGFKLLFAILFVLIGFKVFGAMIGVIIGFTTGLMFSIYFNRDILKKKSMKVSFKGIYPQSVPYFITMLVIFLVLSLDIILAKRFFSPEIAGKYAVISMLGKMIFFGTIAIGKAMFPLTSEKTDNNESSIELFKKSFVIIASLCTFVVLIYAFFPKLVIGILYGSQYLEMAPYLVYSGIALSFLSLSNIILIYGLSTSKIKNSHYLFSFLIIEVGLFYLFHDNVMEFILGFMVSSIIMFIGSFLIIKNKEN